jgi:uncharacterized protein YxeA
MLKKQLVMLIIIIQPLIIIAQNSLLTTQSKSQDKFNTYKNQSYFGTPIFQSSNLNTPSILNTSNVKHYEMNKMQLQGTYKHPMLKVGKILTYIAVPLVIIGTVMVANADSYSYTCVNGECEGDPMGGTGVAILSIGTPLAITGVTLWIIGKHKS